MGSVAAHASVSHPASGRLIDGLEQGLSRIEATLILDFINAIVEARNAQIQLLTPLAHRFGRVEALAAIAMFDL